MTDLEFQEMVRSDSELIKWRRDVDMPRVRRLIQEHKAEMGRAGDWMRIFAIFEKIEDIDFKLFEMSILSRKTKTDNFATLFLSLKTQRLQDMREKLSVERNILLNKGLPERKSKSNFITPDMIDRARDYPIDNLLDIHRGYALCLWHEDRHPSMYVKNNFAHCFSCHKTADPIDVYRKIHGTTFPEAVKALQ